MEITPVVCGVDPILDATAEEEKARLRAEGDARKFELVKRINEAAAAARNGMLVETENGEKKRTDWTMTDKDRVLLELIQFDLMKSLERRRTAVLMSFGKINNSGRDSSH